MDARCKLLLSDDIETRKLGISLIKSDPNYKYIKHKWLNVGRGPWYLRFGVYTVADALNGMGFSNPFRPYYSTSYSRKRYVYAIDHILRYNNYLTSQSTTQ